jgi:hypothetical protein
MCTKYHFFDVSASMLALTIIAQKKAAEEQMSPTAILL